MKPQARVDSGDPLTVWVTMGRGEVMFSFTLDSEAFEFAEFINDNCEYASVAL